MTVQGVETAVPVELVVLAATVGLALAALLVALLRSRSRLLLERPCAVCSRSFSARLASCPSCGYAPPPPRAEVAFLSGPLQGETVALAELMTTFGAVADASIVLADRTIARKHLAIRRDGAVYELAD